THHSRQELHRMALQKAGDWGQQAMEYCPESGLPMDHVIGAMLDLGLTREDLRHLELLSDPAVLQRLPVGERHLDKRSRDDVVTYMRLWADGLEERWLAQQEIPDSLTGIDREVSTASEETSTPESASCPVSSARISPESYRPRSRLTV
ncbi:MAG: hypothetical protein AAF657_38825, partial [Acidobacteriota bacterium]